MDTSITLVDGNAAIAGAILFTNKELIARFFGPTVDYLGQETKNLVERCLDNIGNIVSIAIAKSAERLNEPGVVNSRVLKDVVIEGAFCEDSIVAEYIGGVLAASRTSDEVDDRGICFLNEINSLSSYQLKTHFAVYSAICRAGCPGKTDPTHWYGQSEYETVTLMFSDDSYMNALGIVNDQYSRFGYSHSRVRFA